MYALQQTKKGCVCGGLLSRMRSRRCSLMLSVERSGGDEVGCVQDACSWSGLLRRRFVPTSFFSAVETCCFSDACIKVFNPSLGFVCGLMICAQIVMSSELCTFWAMTLDKIKMAEKNVLNISKRRCKSLPIKFLI